MTYESSEVSQHSGKPVELFKYIGTYQNFYYTSNTTEVEFQGPDDIAPNLYVPIPMKRSQVNVGTQNDDNAEITIDMPVTVDLVAIYGFQISPPDLFLIVYRQHNPGEYVRYWGGPVDNINVVRGTASIRVPSRLAQALSADFPNVYYQGPCNHSLGDARCGVDMAAHELTTTIDAIAGKAITVDSIGTLDGKLIGGEALLLSGERRMIISQAANVVTVNYPFAGAAVTDDIVLSEGCDLAFAGDCGTKFSNQERFGGMPFIPPKNVFATGLEPGKDVTDDACLPSVIVPPVFEGWYMKVIIEWQNPIISAPNLGFWMEALTTGPRNGTGGGVGANYTVLPDLAGIEFTFTDNNFLAPQNWNFRGQWSSGNASGAQKARMTYRRWTDFIYTRTDPIAGSETFADMDGFFGLDDLFPVDWFFTF